MRSRIEKAAVAMLAWLVCASCVGRPATGPGPWLRVDDFESGNTLAGWSHVDAQNETDPHIPDPQVSAVRREAATDNRFMLRKPAADGVVGNRKALGFKPLPVAVPVGATYTLYARINVEYFPNNHSFGLSNVDAAEIPDLAYDAFEPMIRVTDKYESDGYKNDGTITVLDGYKTYIKIVNPATRESAEPLREGEWYETWCVVNNARLSEGGQRYDLYVRGGEFESRQLVYSGATFRMRRELPLQFFIAISNTGPHEEPYGNGGVRYDDIYIAPGRNLSSPIQRN